MICFIIRSQNGQFELLYIIFNSLNVMAMLLATLLYTLWSANTRCILSIDRDSDRITMSIIMHRDIEKMLGKK